MAYLRSGKRTRPFSRGAGRRMVRRRLNPRGATAPRVSRQRFRTSGTGVTDHYDRKQVYRKRRMPRFRRRRWKAFSRKVKFVAEKEYGTRTVVFNRSITFNNANAGFQCLGYVYLYGNQSTDSWANDINSIGALETQQAINAPTVDYNVDKTTKVMFQSAILDITVRNTSFITLTGLGDSSLRLEVDAYELSVNTPAINVLTARITVNELFGDGSTDTFTIPGAASGLAIQNRGATPFDIPMALSRYRIKIWKKTKYILNNGESFTYQVRDPKRRVITHQNMIADQGFNKRGWTRIIYFIAKLLPGTVLGAAAGQATEQLTVGATRKYMYKVEGINADGDAYLQDT